MFLFNLYCLFSPCLCPHVNVAAQAFAVEPGFAAVDVADVDEVLVGLVFRRAVVGE